MSANLDYAISFRSVDGRYCGVWAVPGDDRWRSCKRPCGQPRWCETAAEAEADAGHALVEHLQRAKMEAA